MATAEDYKQLLQRNDVDAVLIATPDHWHCPMLIDAVNAGKDVYIEKPLSNTLEPMTQALRAVRKTKPCRAGRHAAAVGSALPGMREDRPGRRAGQGDARDVRVLGQRLRASSRTGSADSGGAELGPVSGPRAEAAVQAWTACLARMVGLRRRPRH